MDSTAVRYLRISGTLLPDNRLFLRPSYLTESAAGSSDDRESGVTIECFDEDRLLLRWGASLRAALGTGPAAAARKADATGALLLRAKMPFPAATKRILFRKGELLLAETAVPEHGPVLAGPPKISKGRGRIRIDWSARHPDGLPLYYHVRASGDGGKTWSRLGSRLVKTGLTVPVDALVGRSNCLVEVVAYDGVNTAAARTRFRGAAPERLQVVILAPLARSLVEGDRVSLWAHARLNSSARRIDPLARFEWAVDGKVVASGCSAGWTAVRGASDLSVVCRYAGFQARAMRRLKVAARAAGRKPSSARGKGTAG